MNYSSIVPPSALHGGRFGKRKIRFHLCERRSHPQELSDKFMKLLKPFCEQTTPYFTASRRFNQFHSLVRVLCQGFSVLRAQSSQENVNELEGVCESEKRSN